MNEKNIKNAREFANNLTSTTICANYNFTARQLVKESRKNAENYEWLYHCTNSTSLLSILKSKEFWLTNLKNVNDTEEADRIDVPSYEKSYYVCCFSYDEKISSEHWEEYGSHDKGIIIGVKRNWFSKSPVFITTSNQKCTEENMRIIPNIHKAFDLKIKKEKHGYAGIDPYHIFDFGFYQIVYDDALKKTMLEECIINLDSTSIAGESVTLGLPGIIKSCAGWCKRQGQDRYWKNWESEKEVRLKVGIQKLSKSIFSQSKTNLDIYFKQIAIPLSTESFDTIRIAFSPCYKDRNELLDKIEILCPNSKIEVLY